MSTRIIARVLAAASTALVLACAANPDPVPLVGERSELDALAGEWSGEYTGGSSGGGSIALTITAGADTAHGDVLMTPTTSGRPVTAAEDPNEHVRHARSSEVLRIAFVHVGGGEVQGRLEPFTSPECNCRVSAVFRGRVEGDRIRGSFRTTDPNGYSRDGEWSVRRR
jgi:hypothetical protein